MNTTLYRHILWAVVLLLSPPFAKVAQSSDWSCFVNAGHYANHYAGNVSVWWGNTEGDGAIGCSIVPFCMMNGGCRAVAVSNFTDWDCFLAFDYENAGQYVGKVRIGAPFNLATAEWVCANTYDDCKERYKVHPSAYVSPPLGEIPMVRFGCKAASSDVITQRESCGTIPYVISYPNTNIFDDTYRNTLDTDVFLNACNARDACYSAPWDAISTTEGFNRCNQEFLNQMYRACARQHRDCYSYADWKYFINLFAWQPFFAHQNWAKTRVHNLDATQPRMYSGKKAHRIKTHVVTDANVIKGLKADVQLTNGVTVTNQTVTPGNWNFYSITIPAGTRTLTLATSSATNDIDIYTRAVAKPNESSYACRPYIDGGNESCVMGDPTPGMWWLGVRNYNDEPANYSVTGKFSTTPTYRSVTPTATSGGSISPATVQQVLQGKTKTFTITPNAGYLVKMLGTCGGELVGNLYTTLPMVSNCTVIANFTLPVQLTSGVTLNGQNVVQDAWKYYKITVPVGTRTLTLTTTNASGDIDLYARAGGVPTDEDDDYDCASYTESGNETCEISDPAPDTWWLGVQGYESGNFSVTAKVSNQPVSRKVTPTATAGGVISPATVQTVTAGTNVTFTLTPNAGLAVGIDGTCDGYLSGNTYTTESVFTDCTVEANFVLPTVLNNGVQLNGQSVDDEQWKYYKFLVPATGIRGLTFAVTNATSDVDIYVRRGFLPTESAYDCAPYTDSGNETCILGDPIADVWWLGVYGDAGDYSVKATTSTVPVNRIVTPTATSGGTISPATAQAVIHGTTKAFTVTPNAGYVAGLGGTCDGNLVGNTYTTLPITENCTIIASFVTPVQLTNGVARNDSVALENWKFYQITIPTGTASLILTTTNATADVDIYARAGNLPPTKTTFDCVKYTASGNETCTIADPTPGVWWLGIHGFAAGNYAVKGSYVAGTNHTITPTAGSGGIISPATVQTVTHRATKVFTLTPNTGFVAGASSTCGGNLVGNVFTTNPIVTNCTVQASFAAPIQLTNGVTLNSQSVALGAWKFYKITVPANTPSLTFTTTKATANVDTFIKYGAAPTATNYEEAPNTNSGNETYTKFNPTAGTWWLGVYGYAAGQFSVTATMPPDTDFVVTNVTFNPAIPAANGTFTATVTVKNQGTVAGDGKFLDVWSHQRDGTACGTAGNARQAVGTLAPGATKVMTFTGLPAGIAGNKLLRAFVDSGCTAPEGDEINNQTTFPYTVNAATGIDLAVTNIVLTPAVPVVDGIFTAAITVKNLGTVAGNGNFLDVWNSSYQTDNESCGAASSLRQPVGTLAAGATKVLTFVIKANDAGMKLFRAFVDSGCGTAENNEGNNQKTLVYPINQPTGIDFVVTNVTLTPAIPTANGTFTAAVTVKNQGTVAGDGKFLTIWNHQPNTQICGAYGGNTPPAVGTIAAGATKVVTVTGLASGSAGAKTLRAFVDSGCGTAEANEANNQFTKAYTVN